jgi:tetratricopeptide (TPR) repeat protein
MLVDDGVIDTRVRPWRLDAARLDTLRVPPTLVGVLQARLDALPAHELRALQWASVVGSVFWDAALAAIDSRAPDTLPQLAQRALVQARAGSAFADTDERAFAHALLHEVTYGTVLKAERRDAHAAVAHWLAQRVGQRGAEFLAVAAEHFERAGDHERALHHWDLACHEASQRYANDAALQLTERVLAQPALTDARWRYTVLGLRHDLLERMGRLAEADQALAAVQAHADACHDRAMQADLLATRMLIADRAGRSDEAARLADEALVCAAPTDPGSAVARALAHGERCWLAILRADWPAVARELAAARAAADEASQVPRRGMGSSAYGMQLQVMEFEALARQGLAQATVDAARAALPGCERRPRDRFNVLVRLVGSLAELGQNAEALLHAQAALALATAAGLPRQRAVACSHMGHALRLHGRLDEAMAVLDEGLAEARRADMAPIQPSLLSHQADVLQARGQLEAALGRAIEAVALCELQDNPLHAAACRCQAAQLAVACGEPERARALLDAALAATCDDTAEKDALRVRQSRLEPTPLGQAWQVAQALHDPRAAALHAELHERLAHALSQLPDAQARRWLLDTEPWALLPDRPPA